MNAPDLYLLVWDTSNPSHPDAEWFAEATERSRELLAQLWVEHGLSAKMMTDDPGADADIATNGLRRFLRHNVDLADDLRPLVVDRDDLLKLKLQVSNSQLMFFPPLLGDAKPVPVEEIARLMVVASTLQEVFEAEARLKALYTRLNHLTEAKSKADIKAQRDDLVHLFSGGDFPQDGDQ